MLALQYLVGLGTKKYPLVVCHFEMMEIVVSVGKIAMNSEEEVQQHSQQKKIGHLPLGETQTSSAVSKSL